MLNFPNPINVVDAATPNLVARRFSLWARLGERGVSTFDATGRLLTARLDSTYFRRGLDNTVVSLERVPAAAYPWTTQRLADNSALFSRIREHLHDVRQLAEIGDSQTLVNRAIAGLDDGYLTDVEQFNRVVGPVPIVPPNHSRAVVLRLTEGCQYNACRFCELYQETRFRVRPPSEWRQHIRAVLNYFGDGAGIRPAIWVGDASALEAGVDGFCAALDVLREEVRVLDGDELETHLFKGADPHVFDGIYAFADVPRASRLTTEETRELRARGVRRLYLGVETGCSSLLREVRKPHNNEQVVQAVRRLHDGDIGVGVILLVGPGGRRMAAAHRRDTTRLVTDLALDERDFIFLSPLDRHSRAAGVAGDHPHDDHELADETRLLRTSLRQAVGPKLRIADYGLESFVY